MIKVGVGGVRVRVIHEKGGGMVFIFDIYLIYLF